MEWVKRLDRGTLFKRKRDIFFIIRGGKVNYMCKSRNVSCGKQKVEEDSFNDMSCLYGHLP